VPIGQVITNALLFDKTKILKEQKYSKGVTDYIGLHNLHILNSANNLTNRDVVDH